MCRTTRLAVLLGTAVLILLTPDLAAAAPTAPPSVNDLTTVINNLRYWIMGVLGSVATLFLCIGGARYLMAGGDPSEIERAKGSFKSAAVGYALALLAPVVLTILNSILVK
ncbi:pilin [Actinoplanes sp. NBC_00393]|uniref:pilin n=1 Tax=Actinoplanes sp. NBC_00393 TaxID=2975953 RepID=UPI002E1C03CC